MASPSASSFPSAQVDGVERLHRMERDWDARARENARYYVNTAREEWTDVDFFASGETTVAEEILPELRNIGRDRPLSELRALEIGCGAGRVTRALAKIFGEVHAVDVSGEMIALARTALTGFANAFVYHNNGRDLRVVPDLAFDFAFSSIVFQHIPSAEVIENYVREAARLLRPGALFKFQVQGVRDVRRRADDTWLGVPFSEQSGVQMAYRNGFEPIYRHGAGTQYFWLWFYRR